MRFKNYFNNLEKYWSANFLALLSSTFFLSFILWLLVNLVSLSFETTNLSEYIEFVTKLFSYGISNTIIFFPISCFLLVRIFIFYIFIIISKQKWCIIASILAILIFLSKFFVDYKDFTKGTGFGDIVFFYLLPLTVLGTLISIGIYLILLLLELIPKFRVPSSLVLQNSIFKTYIRIFYRFYFVIILAILYTLIDLIFIN